MKVLSTLTALFLLWSLPASAKSLLLELRGESDSLSYNEAAGKEGSHAFTLPTARVDYKGEISENFSYRFRFRLNGEDGFRGVDGISARIDHASMTHQMPGLALTVGRTTTDVGGHETIADSRDLYLKSEANKAFTGTYMDLTAKKPAFYQTKYNAGLKAKVGLGESDLTFLLMNNPEAENEVGQAAGKTAQKRLFHGVVWKGKFLENSLQPVLSYHGFGSNRDSLIATGDTSTQLCVAGLKWLHEGSFAQLDYAHLNTQKLMIAGAETDFLIASWVAEAGYRFGDWAARVKAELSKVTEKPDGGAKTENEVNGYGLAFEYHLPELTEARYFLALNQKTRSASGASDQVESQALLGFVMAHDFLK